MQFFDHCLLSCLSWITLLVLTAPLLQENRYFRINRCVLKPIDTSAIYSQSVSFEKNIKTTVSNSRGSPNDSFTDTIISSSLFHSIPTTTTKSSTSSLHPIFVNEQDSRISFEWQDGQLCTLLEGFDKQAIVERDPNSGGSFISFKFLKSSTQHDGILGMLPSTCRLLAHSRIKRWWMAPSFPENVDEIPVETQLLLLEIPVSLPTPTPTPITTTIVKNYDIIPKLEYSLLRTAALTNPFVKHLLGTDNNIEQDEQQRKQPKMYAIIAPLIDFDRGFRATLYGSKEAGSPFLRGLLSARIESGDPNVTSSRIDDAVYVAAGSDPYFLLEVCLMIINNY